MTPPAGPRPPARGTGSGRAPAGRAATPRTATQRTPAQRTPAQRTPAQRSASASRSAAPRAGSAAGRGGAQARPRPAARSGRAGTGTARPPAPRTRVPSKQVRARAAAARHRRRLRPLGRPEVRLRGGLAVLLVLLVVLGARLVQLQGVDRDGYAATADGQRIVTSALVAHRGSITDRDGEPLALTVDARRFYGEPRTIAKGRCAEIAATRAALAAQGTPLSPAQPCTPAEIAARLSPLIGVSQAELTAKLSETKPDGSHRAYVVLAEDRDPEVAQAVAALDLPGIGTEVTPRRDHPGGDLAANITGFTLGSGAPAGGVEAMLDEVLSGKDGTTSREVDGAGRTIPTAERSRTDAVPGRDVQLTIDRDLQWYAQEVLAQKVAETQAANGSVIVLDVKTGEVLAMATAPTFDASKPGDSPASHRNNPAIGDIYDPGSVNKIITVASAIERGLVSPTTPLTVPYSQQFGAKLVKDSHEHPTERLTVNGVMIQSSNVGTVQIATRLGKQGVYDAMRRFGYGEKTGIGLPGESAGLLPRPEDWSGSSMGTIPIGQGVSVTALQVASVYQTVANGGLRVPPSIVRSVVAPDGTVTPHERAAPRRVVSARTAAVMMPMLEGVVSDEGTAPLAAIPGYRIAGKTGTADRAALRADGEVRYQSGDYVSSFVGFAPADAPRFVTAVVLQGTGKAGYYGGSTAGPVFKQVMGFALQSMGVPPTGRPFTMPRVYADGRK